MSTGGKNSVKVKIISKNKRAWHDYEVLDTLEAGICLAGTEVKSIRAGSVNLKECYVIIKDGEAFAVNMRISPYEKGNIFNRDPMRNKKLLLHKKEIKKLGELIAEKGLTVVPLAIYLKHGLMKLELGVCRGKKLYDKRDAQAKKDATRDIERETASK